MKERVFVHKTSIGLIIVKRPRILFGSRLQMYFVNELFSNTGGSIIFFKLVGRGESF